MPKDISKGISISEDSLGRNRYRYSKRHKKDAFHLWLALNKMSHVFKEQFMQSHNRSIVLESLDRLKRIFQKQINKDEDIGSSIYKETEALETSLDSFESILDSIDWTDIEFLNEGTKIDQIDSERRLEPDNFINLECFENIDDLEKL